MSDDSVLQVFEAELRDSVKESKRLLLSLDASHSKVADLQEVHRLAHSINGASRIVGLDQIAGIADALEATLRGLVRLGVTPDPSLKDLLLKSFDGMASAFEAFLAGEPFDEEPWVLSLTRVAPNEF